MKKEFKSPYQALAAQTDALARLVDALQNAHEHGLHFRIEYRPKGVMGDDVKKFFVKASPCDLYDYNEADIPLPDTFEWDISHLFRSRMLGGTDQLPCYLFEYSEDGEN